VPVVPVVPQVEVQPESERFVTIVHSIESQTERVLYELVVNEKTCEVTFYDTTRGTTYKLSLIPSATTVTLDDTSKPHLRAMLSVADGRTDPKWHNRIELLMSLC
jgi:hypothetical protein